MKSEVECKSCESIWIVNNPNISADLSQCPLCCKTHCEYEGEEIGEEPEEPVVEEKVEIKEQEKPKSNRPENYKTKHRFTDEMIEFIEQNSINMTDKEMTKILNDSFNTDFSMYQIKRKRQSLGLTKSP